MNRNIRVCYRAMDLQEPAALICRVEQDPGAFAPRYSRPGVRGADDPGAVAAGGAELMGVPHSGQTPLTFPVKG